MASGWFAKHAGELVSLATAHAAEAQVPGAQIGVIAGDDEHVASIGICDVRTQGAVTDRTLFRIGSITKVFTATVLTRLAREGRLDLDLPVRRYVPEFQLSEPGATERVTVRHLLLHTGGWMPHLERVADTPDSLKVGARGQVHSQQIAAPGTLFSYNGVGYMVAGRVIEAIAGCSYEDAIRTMLLRPLRMDRTKFATESDQDIAGDHTVRDGRADTLTPYDEGGRWALPSGGLRSTAADMLQFARCHLGETSVLDSAAARAMAEPQATVPSPRESKALSWFVRDLGTEQLLMHLGGPVGQQALLAVCPRRRFALVVHTNSAVGTAVVNALLARALEIFLGVGEPAMPQPFTLEASALNEYVGRYVGLESDLEVTSVDGALALLPTNKGPYADRPTPTQAQVRFWARDRVVGSEGWTKGQYGDFVRDAAGRVAYFRWSGRARAKV